MPESIVIDERFRGIERIAQGGYTSGLLASRLSGPARVMLRGAVPMGRALTVEQDGEGASLSEDGALLAEATAHSVEAEPPEPVSARDAQTASEGFPGHRGHPFPGCFCCGPQRDPGDGLRIFPGRHGEEGVVAAPWTPDASVAGEGGTVRPEVVWAAFDCPQLWALMMDAPYDSDERVVTGAMETDLRLPLAVGEQYVVAARPSGGEGRRLYADAAIFAESGDVVAVSRQTAVLAGAGVPLGLAAYMPDE